MEELENKIKVLLIEDNSGYASLVKIMLSEIKGTCFSVENVDRLSEGLKRLEQNDFSIVLLDLGLPDSNGIDTFRTIRARNLEIPLVVLTEFDNKDAALFAIKNGAQDYLIKDKADSTILSISIGHALERKQLEKELRKKENELNVILESTADGILAIDNKGKVIKANKRFAELWRIPDNLINAGDDDALLNFVLDQLINPKEFLDKVQLLYNSTDEDTDILFFKDGRIFERYSAPLLMNNIIMGRVWSFSDITERKRAEMALEMSLSEEKNIMDTILDIVFVLDLNGNLVKWNRSLEKVTGYSSEEFSGKPAVCFFDEEHQPVIAQAIREAFEKGYNEVESPLRRKDGTTIAYLWNGAVLKDRKGSIIGISGVGRDLTERKQAEKILKESEIKYRTFIENIQDGIFLIQNGKIIFANKIFAQLGGYSLEEVIGKDFRILVAPEDLKMVVDRYTRRMAGEEVPKEYEFHLLHKDGITQLIVNMTVDRINYFGGVAALGTLKDITERKRAEDARLKLQKAIDTSGEAIFLTNLEGIFTYVNPGFTAIYGYTTAEIVGKLTPRILKSGTLEPKVYDVFWKTLLSGQEVRGEFVNKRKDGNSINVEGSANPIFDENKNITGFLGIQRDITERKRAEEALREQATLIDEAHDAILVQDITGKILFWNKGAESLYGWTKDEVIGKDTFELLFQKGLTSQPADSLQEVWQEGKWIGTLKQTSKGGKEILVESRWTLLSDEKGKPKSILVINTDITEKKQLEAQFLRTQRLESIGMLAGGIAHDLNNVLAPILLGVELVRKKVTDDSAKSLLNTIASSALRGSDLIKQVLSFARGVEGERTIVQLRHLINEIGKVINETFPKTITFRLDLIKELWPIMGDSTQLHQVLMNICINARDAMLQGGTLEIKAENILLDKQYTKMDPEAKEGAYIVLSITDTGTGIPDEVIGKIFEPFFTTKEISKGTGLGLSTVNAIVKAHNGFIKVQSKIGKGTTFKIYLPALTTQESEKAVSQVVTKPSGDGELVLVVDDEAAVREITRETLEAYNYRVITANDGTEAVAVFAERKNEIAVVLTDMVMPFMDGTATIRAMQKINPAVKIIISSGRITSENTAKISNVSANAFLVKPFTSEKLLKVLREVILNQ